MNDILNKATVLVLNRNWQAINIRTPADAFCQMATGVATGLEIELSDGARAEARLEGRQDVQRRCPVNNAEQQWIMRIRCRSQNVRASVCRGR